MVSFPLGRTRRHADLTTRHAAACALLEVALKRDDLPHDAMRLIDAVYDQLVGPITEWDGNDERVRFRHALNGGRRPKRKPSMQPPTGREHEALELRARGMTFAEMGEATRRPPGNVRADFIRGAHKLGFLSKTLPTPSQITGALHALHNPRRADGPPLGAAGPTDPPPEEP